MLVSLGWPAVTEAILSSPGFQDPLLEAHRLVRDELPKVKVETRRAELARASLEPLLADPAVKRFHRARDLMQLVEEVSGPEAEVLPYLYLTAVTASKPYPTS